MNKTKKIMLSTIISLITTLIIFILGSYLFGYIYGLIEIYTKSQVIAYIGVGIIIILIFGLIFYGCYKLFSKEKNKGV